MAKTLEDKLFDTLNEILNTLSNGEMAVSISSIDDPDGIDTIINNTTDNPVPVVIQNTDSTIDLDVRIAENITIDTSTPLDVSLSDLDSNNKLPVAIDSLPNVTIDTTTPLDVDIQNTNLDVTIQNTSIDTNATIQGTPNVNVSNASINTNATIQNTNIVTRPELNVGSGIFNYLAGDNNGRQYIYSQTNWDTSALAFLQTSSTVDHWINAYADGVLNKKYVETYNDEFEETVYLTHAKFTTGNALKLIYQYTTQNSQKVVESVYPSVVTWSYETNISGSVSVAASNIIPADPNSTISIHQRVADLTITDNTFGDVTISISGTNASLYHIHNVQTGSHGTSMTYVAGNTYQVHTAGTDFSGASYAHQVTITVTGDEFGVTDSVNIDLVGTYSATVWSNEEYVATTIDTTNDSKKGVWVTDSFTDNKGWFPSLEDNSGGAPTGIYTQLSDTSISFWLNTSNWNQTGSGTIWFQIYHDHGAPFSNTDTPRGYMNIHISGNYLYYIRSNRNYSVSGSWSHYYHYWYVPSVTTGDWHNFTFVTDQNTTSVKQSIIDTDLYIDGSLFTTASGYNGSGQDPDTTNIVRAGLGSSYLNFAGTIDNWSTATTNYTYKLDEVTTWSKKLTTSEITELYNSGEPIDPTTHSASADLERYIRCGDDANDGTSLNDASGATDGFSLDNWNSVDSTTALTASDSIYVPGSSSFTNTYYLAQNSANSMQFYTSDLQPRSDQKWCLSFWMKSSQFTSNGAQQRIFGAVYSAGSNGFQIRKRNSYTNIWEMFFSAGNSYLVAEYTIPNNANLNNQWVHVLVNYSYDSAANSNVISDTIFLNSLDLYINGTACSKADSAGYSSGTHSTSGVDHGINLGYWAGSTYFVEAYDELAYWSGTDLSTSEIALVYNGGNKVIDLQNTTNLTAPSEWWRHEDSNHYTYETISGSNSGSITGATQTAY